MSPKGRMQHLAASLREAWRGRTLRTEFQNKLKLHAPKADLLFIRAQTMARAGSWDMAEDLFAEAARIEPTFADAFERRGEVLDVMGQRALALKQYEHARKVRSNLRLGPPDRHFVLRHRGHFIAEMLAYNSVVRSLRKNALPYLARGNAYLSAGHPETALLDYERALKLKPGSPEITVLKAEALSMLGLYLDAEEAFNSALVAHPRDAEALGGRAIVQIAQGKVDGAKADWRRQFELLGAQAAARACVALRMADYELALPELKKALEKEAADPYWRLYQLAARARLGLPQPGETEDIVSDEAWPGPLLALHAGRLSEDQVMKLADTDSRRGEAAFQLGALAFARDRMAAKLHWRQVVERAGPSMIEYAAARNELSRLG